jgi:hypothetical protein
MPVAITSAKYPGNSVAIGDDEVAAIEFYGRR